MDVLANLQKLPAVCAVRHPTSNEPVLIKRGELGYHAWALPGASHGLGDDPVALFNARHGVTQPQQNAMLHGSMFGWGTPAADVDNPINSPAPEKESTTRLRSVMRGEALETPPRAG